MGTTRNIISEWFDRGREQGATHLIVVCDTFDWEDYPVFVMPHEDARQKAAGYAGPNMQKVMEVYALYLPKEMQMNEHRSFHYENETPQKEIR